MQHKIILMIPRLENPCFLEHVKKNIIQNTGFAAMGGGGGGGNGQIQTFKYMHWSALFITNWNTELKGNSVHLLT